MATKKGLHKIILQVPGDHPGQVHTYTVCDNIAAGDAFVCVQALQSAAAPGHTYSMQ